MGKNARKPILKIRYRKPEKRFGVSLLCSRTSNSNGKKHKHRILSVQKVPMEKILRVHEFLPFDKDALLREFREQERKQREVNKRYGQEDSSRNY